MFLYVIRKFDSLKNAWRTVSEPLPLEGARLIYHQKNANKEHMLTGEFICYKIVNVEEVKHEVHKSKAHKR